MIRIFHLPGEKDPKPRFSSVDSHSSSKLSSRFVTSPAAVPHQPQKVSFLILQALKKLLAALLKLYSSFEISIDVSD